MNGTPRPSDHRPGVYRQFQDARRGCFFPHHSGVLAAEEAEQPGSQVVPVPLKSSSRQFALIGFALNGGQICQTQDATKWQWETASFNEDKLIRAGAPAWRTHKR